MERALRLLDSVDDVVTALHLGCRAHWPERLAGRPFVAALAVTLAAAALLLLLA
jgi:hypothetical protein